ncbi:MAG: hypothetical protein HY919_01435 [Elusimicrobia bacterium]|nr:hypothetical protein [Elusimicrobiota bacterium]
MMQELFQESHGFFKVPFLTYLLGGILLGVGIRILLLGRYPSFSAWVIYVCGFISILAGIMMFNFDKMQTTITDRGIKVQFGIFKKFIPKENILACSPFLYNWRNFGGWGIRRSGDNTTAYSVVSTGKHSIRITYLNKHQQKADLVISTIEEEKICNLLKKVNPNIIFD